MSVTGHEVQIVKKTEDGKYELDGQALEQILMGDDIKHLPVVVISVPGYRNSGRSFLLNFILRYLTSSTEARSNGSWLGNVDSNDPLVGFSWGSGDKRNTKGILMWSKPLVTTLNSSEQVAIFLMDSEGFSASENQSKCFALSMMLSSVRIYNISSFIGEPELLLLKPFVEYGQYLKSTNKTTLEKLHVLLRDSFADYGKNIDYLKSRIQNNYINTETSLAEDKLISAFDEVTCYLMPHPGFKTLRSRYNGNIKDLQTDFKTHMVQFINSVCTQEKLQPILIVGVKLKANDYCRYFKDCFNIFNSRTQYPQPEEVIQAVLTNIIMETVTKYSAGMSTELSEGLSFSKVDFEARHNWFNDKARNDFDTIMVNWPKENFYNSALSKEINFRKKLYANINTAIKLKAIESARQVYYSMVAEEAKQKQFCLNSKGTQKIHDRALEKALETFDASQKKITENEDPDRAALKSDLQNQEKELHCSPYCSVS